MRVLREAVVRKSKGMQSDRVKWRNVGKNRSRISWYSLGIFFTSAVITRYEICEGKIYKIYSVTFLSASYFHFFFSNVSTDKMYEILKYVRY